MSKLFKSSPLPFVGQKRFFIKEFQAALEKIPGDGAGWTIVDVFGGSGLLSHVAKHTKPAARVIYNDFDNFAERLQNIPDTNRLRRLLAAELEDCPKESRITPDKKAKLLKIIDDFDGYKDWRTIASWLLFSGKSVVGGYRCFVEKNAWHNCLRKSDYDDGTDYLRGVEVVGLDYQELLNRHAEKEKTLLIFDPPYVSTAQGAYAKENYFGMVDFLRVMKKVRPPFIFFGSTRSELPQYLDFLKESGDDEFKKFEDVERFEKNAVISGNTDNYQDNMIVCF